jgi:hypothetical protein
MWEKWVCRRVFPHGDPHHMSSGTGERPFPNYGISASEAILAKLSEALFVDGDT